MIKDEYIRIEEDQDSSEFNKCLSCIAWFFLILFLLVVIIVLLSNL